MSNESLLILKDCWALAAVFGLIVSIVAMYETYIDLRIIKKRQGKLDDWDSRYIQAKRSYRDEIIYLFIQLVLVMIRVGAIFGPQPVTPEFRKFWGTDGTIVMIMGLLIALSRVINLRDRYRLARMK